MSMKIIIYIIRFLLASFFMYIAIERLINPTLMEANTLGVSIKFIEFYNLLQTSGFMSFVILIQTLCSVLLVFKKTYLVGAIMLTSLLLCFIMIHLFISKSTPFLIFDVILFVLNTILIGCNYKLIKPLFLKTKQGWI